MYSDIRERLLKIADFLIKRQTAFIDGLEVQDILLTGSSAKYIYHNDSDIDVQIVVKNISCPVLKKSNAAMTDFLGLTAHSLVKAIGVKINNLWVDMKFTGSVEDLFGCYSILNNKWVMDPAPYSMEKITFEGLIKNYYLFLADKYKFLQSVQLDGGKISLKFLNKLEDYYINKVVGGNRNLLSYLTYKLLCTQGEIRGISREYVGLLQDTLSLGNIPNGNVKALMPSIRRLMNPKGHINPDIFGEGGVMRKQVRNSLLKVINFMIEKCISPIDGIEVDDILLVGSSCTNLYYEKSDYDIMVTIKVQDGSILKNDKRSYATLLQMFQNSLFHKDVLYKSGDIFVDLKFSDSYDNASKSYSILHNCWIDKPCLYQYKDYMQAEKLLKLYYKKMEEIYRTLAQMDVADGQYTKKAKDKVLFLYNSLVKISSDVNPQDKKHMRQYLAYKVLSSQNIPRSLFKLSSQIFSASFSLERKDV